MPFRKIIFWFHLIIGVVTTIIIFLMSATGIFLTYEKQMTARADRNLYRIEAPEDAKPLSAEKLLEKFIEARPQMSPSSMTFSSDPAMPPSIMVFPGGQTFVHPYTGEILGAGAQGTRKFFRFMTDLHRWLALTGEGRGTGRSITGACNLAFLFIIITGIYLWFPKKWSRKTLRFSTWFHRGLGSKARDTNWHYTFGFWGIIPLILIVISGIVISYPWASKLVYRIAGSETTFQGRPRGGPSEGPQPVIDASGINDMLGIVQSKSAGWKSIDITIPTIGDKAVSFAVNRGMTGQPQHRSSVTFDKNSHEIIGTEAFKDMDPGLRARIWMRFVHTGEYYGAAGQTIAGIASLAAVMLTWTGIALSIRRYGRWLKRRQKISPES